MYVLPAYCCHSEEQPPLPYYGHVVLNNILHTSYVILATLLIDILWLKVRVQNTQLCLTPVRGHKTILGNYHSVN